MDLSRFINPRRAKFSVTDVNRGDRRNQNIIDSSPTLAARTLRSGMMAGVTSPARPWFRLTTPDAELSEVGAVKVWLDTVTKRMNTVFLKSNLYNALPTLYGDMGVFGTAAMYIEEDPETVIRCYPFSIGSYAISNNHRLKVDTFYREFRLTVRQLIENFAEKDASGKVKDWSNFSDTVKNLYDRDMLETWIDVFHLIEPNPDHQPKKLESKYKKFSSCYYERGSMGGSSSNYLRDDGDRILSEKGYDFFPVLAPRWEVSGEDVYGTNCPGMEALGDIRQLQLGEKRAAQAIEKMINPPMVGPTSLRNSKASILPGDITYLSGQNDSFKAAHEITFRLEALEQKQAQVRQRISRAFYEDLFLMLAQSDRREITAREIDERHEEKLLALGPVLEQLNQDLLDPLIDITFSTMDKQNLIPPAPQEIQGMGLKVEYVSIMAQAQKLVGIAGLERFAGFVTQVVGAHPDAIDKVDTDQMIDVYGDITSIAPTIVRTDDQVLQIRQAKAKAQQAQQMAEQVSQGAMAAKNLAQAPIDSSNALGQILSQAKAGQFAPQ